MRTKGDKLIEQIDQAREIARVILQNSKVNQKGIVYAFATPKALVINCADHEALWRIEESVEKLGQTIARLQYSIETIIIEKGGKPCYQF